MGKPILCSYSVHLISSGLALKYESFGNVVVLKSVNYPVIVFIGNVIIGQLVSPFFSLSFFSTMHDVLLVLGTTVLACISKAKEPKAMDSNLCCNLTKVYNLIV